MALQASRSQALEFFLSSIQNPHRPRHCGVCLDGAFFEWAGPAECQPLSSEPKFKYQIQYNPEFWNAVMKFLFTPRSKAQLHDLLLRLSKCNCRLNQESVQHYHDISNGRKRLSNDGYDGIHNRPSMQNDIVENMTFVDSWISFLANLFVALSVTISHSSRRSSAKGVATFWPIRMTDLIPFGADNLVQSLMRWYLIIQDPVIFRIMGSLLRVSQELVIPSLITHRFTALVIDMGFVLFTDLSSNPKPGPAESTFLWTLFLWQTADIVHYLKIVLFEANDNDPAYKLPMFRNHELKATQLCSLLLYLLEVPKPDPRPHLQNHLVVLQKDLGTIGHEFLRLFSIHGPSRPPFLVHPLIQELDAQFVPRENIPLTVTILAILRKVRSSWKCSAHGCSNIFQTVGKEFRRCGNCGLVPYCGRKCQKKAWKHPLYPHKLICPIVKDLITKAGRRRFFLSLTQELTKGEGTQIKSIDEEILSSWNTSPMNLDDLAFVSGWDNSLKQSRGYQRPLNHKDIGPGYPDYERSIIFMSVFCGKKGVYLEPLADDQRKSRDNDDS